LAINSLWKRRASDTITSFFSRALIFSFFSRALIFLGFFAQATVYPQHYAGLAYRPGFDGVY
jgi:hypothetical protein